jgi:hypothetical protein
MLEEKDIINGNKYHFRTDYSDYVHYEIDFNDPNWKSDAEKFAKDYLQELIRDNN